MLKVPGCQCWQGGALVQLISDNAIRSLEAVPFHFDNLCRNT